jgi:hypothetical protein
VPGREYSEAERAELARKGQALPDGSYPVPDCGGLHDAPTGGHPRVTGPRWPA